MKLAFFLSSFLCILGPWAHAERVIVMMKDRASFERITLPQQWSSPFPGKIEKRLDNLQTLIVDTTNPADLEKLKRLAKGKEPAFWCWTQASTPVIRP